jgi:hypothetical protein
LETTSIEFRNRPVRAKSDGCRLRQGYGASWGEAVTPWSKSPTSMVWFMVKWAFAARVRLKAKMQKSPENKSVHFPRCRFVRFEVHLLQTPASERQPDCLQPTTKIKINGRDEDAEREYQAVCG